MASLYTGLFETVVWYVACNLLLHFFSKFVNAFSFFQQIKDQIKNK